MRTFIVGDIHGAGLALNRVLSKSDWTPEDRIIFIGDLVNGWEDDRLTLDIISQIDNKIVIFGNHDLAALPFLIDGEVDDNPGVESLMRSYNDEPYRVLPHHKEIFYDAVMVHEEVIDGKSTAFVHCGLPDERYDVSWGFHDFTLNKGMIDRAKDGKPCPHFDEVFVGHSPTPKQIPMQFSNVWMTDCGAGWGGNLAIMDVSTKQYWTQNVRSLYGS